MATIMVVHDEIDIRRRIKIQIERLGHEVFEADNGKTAIQIAIEKIPDLILMDIMMPKVDGIMATKAIKKHETTSEIPVVAITNKWKGDEGDCLNAGCEFMVIKPTTLSEIKNVLRRAGFSEL